MPHSEFRQEGGAVRLGERELFLYRREDDSFYRSTVALLADPGAGFSRLDAGWRLAAGEAARSFRPEERAFAGDRPAAETFAGFDTYWYIWSLTNPETEILRVLSVILEGDIAHPAVTVPPEFLQGGLEYKFEVIVQEESGNRTIAETTFCTL